MTAARILAEVARRSPPLAELEIGRVLEDLWHRAGVAVIHIEQVPERIKPEIKRLMAQLHGRRMR